MDYALHSPGILLRSPHTEHRLTMLIITREQPLQVMKSLEIDIPSGEISCDLLSSLLLETRKMEPNQKRLVFTELAIRLSLRVLAFNGLFYLEFENDLW